MDDDNAIAYQHNKKFYHRVNVFLFWDVSGSLWESTISTLPIILKEIHGIVLVYDTLDKTKSN